MPCPRVTSVITLSVKKYTNIVMFSMDETGQASVEYVLLSLVFLIILGSVTIPLISKSIESSIDVSDTSNVNSAVNSIANAVGVVYANGPGAKRTINVYFPVAGTLSNSNNAIGMPVTLKNGTSKNVNAAVPYKVTFTPSAVAQKTNYNATVEWKVSDDHITVTLTKT
ncbi:MAG: hypothetical protein NKF70_00600 [Methanobacterium sp. ERen5]|nr:MAG: hypothetical protein NKF70_00600 [Methanobacterium sp. ERen5]